MLSISEELSSPAAKTEVFKTALPRLTSSSEKAGAFNHFTPALVS